MFLTIFLKKKISKKMVFCYQNCSDLLWEKIVLVIEKNFEIRGWRPRICKIFEITRTIYSNSERSEQFLVTECFFNLFLEVFQMYIRKGLRNGILLPKLFWPTVRKNCSSDREKVLKFEAEGREVLRSVEQFVRTLKGQNNFW